MNYRGRHLNIVRAIETSPSLVHPLQQTDGEVRERISQNGIGCLLILGKSLAGVVYFLIIPTVPPYKLVLHYY